MCGAATVRAALSRKYTVSRTESASWSRSSCAISSRPVASGTWTRPARRPRDVVRVRGLDALLEHLGVELLGPAAAVARPPAEVGLVHDHRAQLQDPENQRL